MKLRSISIWHKLLLLGLIAVVLCAVPTYLYVRGANKEIRETLTEFKGLAPATALVRLLQPLQVHRDAAAAVLSGDRALAALRATKEKDVTEAFGRVRAFIPPSEAPLIKKLDVAEGEWKSLVTALKDQSYPMEDSYNRHTKLVSSTLNLIETTADYYGLSLDPEANSYHLIIWAFMELPKLTESMGRLRATGTAILGIKQATAEERVSIATMLERTRDGLARSQAQAQKISEANGAAFEKLDAAAAAAQNAAQKLIAVSDLEFMRIEVLRFDAGEYLKLGTVAIDAQFNLIDAARAEVEQILQARVTSYRWTMALLLGMIAALVIVGASAMLWMMRTITRPLNEAIADADAIAAGRLDLVITNIGLDEVGKLRRAMRHMQRNLAHIVASIRENSESVASASREIASSTRDMSARTESQASSLEQTAASMEELNSTFQKNDESSQHVTELTAQAAKAAEQGGVVVSKVTHTMQEIDVSSKKIAEIISVIDSIAFQTNILALNAAVEAARAGEQGRGFAVVASEVRALAQRSGQASKEIRTLISDSVKKVQTGTREAVESGKAMDDILKSVRTVAETMTAMQAVRADQRLGVTQVSRAVEQMNHGTQQTAAMVEEIAATADLLSDQAQHLSEAVSAFKLSGEVAADENADAHQPTYQPADYASVNRLRGNAGTTPATEDTAVAQALSDGTHRPMLTATHPDR